ncbi:MULTISPECIES: LysR substrate-binding domain-containing protein [unclassified Serratia (in: enterobacteria)]|uniref:LysR substrate-binding domain-containing protein n=1 Tax=unclassified Serratia (in: enterobacteria) TaxID=2647522 RepID=UPI0009077101|nr:MULTISPECIES: LysR substrate-binding domain-containing protein [unclassified Serratia (in: enterobacteria)]
MSRLPTVSHLKIFEAIIEHGGVHAAAKALNMTQPNMSRSLRELEAILGSELMIRGPRGMVLTDLGRCFELRVKLVLRELELAVNEVKQVGELHQGHVAFGCSHLKVFKFISNAVTGVLQAYPNADISLYEGQQSEILPALREGKMDFFIGIISSAISLGEFIEEPLFSCSFGVIARKGHPLAQATSVAELRKARWYLPVADAGYYNEMEALFFPAGVESTHSILKGDSVAVAEHLILESDYLSISPKLIEHTDSMKDLFCFIPLKEKLPDGHYSLIYRQQTLLSPLARLLIAEIRKECSNDIAINKGRSVSSVSLLYGKH